MKIYGSQESGLPLRVLGLALGLHRRLGETPLRTVTAMTTSDRRAGLWSTDLREVAPLRLALRTSRAPGILVIRKILRERVYRPML